MRAVDCWCGQMVHADSDEELTRALRDHVAAEHGEERHSDDEVRIRVAEQAYEPPTGDPPWAY
jgi:predicted small metal-binding protein